MKREYSQGCLKIWSKDAFYKIQLRGDSLIKDNENRSDAEIILGNYVMDSKVLFKHPMIIKYPLIESCIVEDDHRMNIIDCLWSHGKAVCFDYHNYHLIKCGLNMIEGSNKDLVVLIQNRLEAKNGVKVHEGPVHGDFHRGNILNDNNDNTFLIDFDCWRNCDIQEIDLLYYYLQEAVNLHGCRYMWMKEWIWIWNNINEFVKRFGIDEHIDSDFRLLWIILLIERAAQEKSLYSQYEIELYTDNLKQIGGQIW